MQYNVHFEYFYNALYTEALSKVLYHVTFSTIKAKKDH